jgi:UDP-N-acetyl-D-mannosaminuronic acid dehydrogenase
MIREDLKIAIFGMGHIGLPTAALFAVNGLKVIGIDINQNIIDCVNSGISPIIEPGLDDLVKKAVEKNDLSATKNAFEAAKKANVMIILVPTPKDDSNNSDLTAVESVTKIISKCLNKDDLVIVESTVPPKTCDDLIIPILEENGLKAGEDFFIAYTPERALPNNTLYEMTHNDRVIGGINRKSAEKASSIYSLMTEGEIIKVNDIKTAEMVKLMENTYRDTNIALANELSKICESVGVDSIKAIKAANHHPRVNIHLPGPGVGGHCLPIDPYFLVEIGKKNGVEASLIQTAREINEKMPQHVFQLIQDSLSELNTEIQGCKIGLLGVAYKGNVGDYRETPAKPLINFLLKSGADVFANDPYVPDEIIKSFGASPVSVEDILKCECVVLVTDHKDYHELNLELMKNKLFVCTRPCVESKKFLENGTIFKGVGAA